jgi:molecular chaperone HtpG
MEYTSLLYIPARAPFDLWDREKRHGIKLYVRRVFIMDDAEQLIPSYLRFVKGIVDSDDLPLNISREILQRNKTIDSIRSGCTRKILDLLAGIARKDAEKYAVFWKEFGRVLKEGIIEVTDKQEDLAKLFRFASTHDDKEEQAVSLEDYVARMPEQQKAIYYISAENFSTAKNSPHLEIFRDKGIEVILLSDPIDEWLTTHLNEFDGKPLTSINKGELDLDSSEEEGKDRKEKGEKAEKEYEDIIKRIKDALNEKVKDVRVTDRLTTSPACLVADENDMGRHLEQIMAASGQSMPGSKPILEINPDHLILQRLKDEQDEDRFSDWSNIIFDQALLSEGGRLEDPAAFVHRLNDMFVELSTAKQVD